MPNILLRANARVACLNVPLCDDASSPCTIPVSVCLSLSLSVVSVGVCLCLCADSSPCTIPVSVYLCVCLSVVSVGVSLCLCADSSPCTTPVPNVQIPHHGSHQQDLQRDAAALAWEGRCRNDHK